MLSFCFLMFSVSLNAQPLEVVYPPNQSKTDRRADDLIELLNMALEKTVETDGPYMTRPTKTLMSPNRYHAQIKLGKEPHVIWGIALEKGKEGLLPIQIPLRKGLLGYRIFLIRKADQAQFSSITSVEALKQLRAGLRMNWVDVHVLLANGFNVITGNSYEGLFKMLMLSRFDYFSRSISEVYEEYHQRRDEFPDMAVEQSLVLYYPMPLYFFVHQDNKVLADRIERGLNKMIADGSFDTIFNKYHLRHIESADFQHRRLLSIPNPLLSDRIIPYHRKELWFILPELKSGD